MFVRWRVLGSSLLFCLCNAFAITALHAAEIHLSSETDFQEVNLNIKDQADTNRDFVSMNVVLTPEARKRMKQATKGALKQPLTLFLDGKAINTSTAQSVINTSRLQISLTREMAREVFPSLLATPVSSVSLSGFSMPEWAIGKWAATPYSDSPSVEPVRGEEIAIAAKTIAGSACKNVNYTVIAVNENLADLRVDRRSKCVLDDVPVSRIVLSKTPDTNRITISLYAIGSDFSGAPNKEDYYQRQ